MRVEIRTQKGVPHITPTSERRMNTEYQVLLTNRGQEVVVAAFSTPGSIVSGMLSDHQAKTRARETADAMKLFLSAQGELDEEPVAALPRMTGGSRRASESAYAEPKTFAKSA